MKTQSTVLTEYPSGLQDGQSGPPGRLLPHGELALWLSVVYSLARLTELDQLNDLISFIVTLTAIIVRSYYSLPGYQSTD